MPTLKFLCTNIFVGAVALASASLVSAQQAALTTTPSGKPFFKSVDLKNGAKQKMDFSVRALGSVRGRVFSDAEGVDSTEPQGIAGVRVSLRSRDAGFENFVIEQYTDETGAYNFEGLRPGKYSIEIDPANLPAQFRMPDMDESSVDVEPLQSTRVNIPVGPQRVITGNVFLDRDGDALYKPGKDAPVDGAMVSVGGNLTVSDTKGAYKLRDLPAGRVALVVRWPKSSESTHVVLDLGTGPVTNRVVNVPVSR